MKWTKEKIAIGVASLALLGGAYYFYKQKNKTKANVTGEGKSNSSLKVKYKFKPSTTHKVPSRGTGTSLQKFFKAK